MGKRLPPRFFLALAALGLPFLLAAPAGATPSPWLPEPRFSVLGNELAVLRQGRLYLVGIEGGREKLLSAIDLPSPDGDARGPTYTLMQAVGDDDLGLYVKDAGCKCFEVTRVHRGRDGKLAITGTVHVAGIDPERYPNSLQLAATDRDYVMSTDGSFSHASADALVADIRQYGDKRSAGTPMTSVPVRRLTVDINGDLARRRGESATTMLVCDFSHDLPACSLRMLESELGALVQPQDDGFLAYLGNGSHAPVKGLAHLQYEGRAGDWFRIKENIASNSYYGPFMMAVSDGGILAVVETSLDDDPGKLKQYALAYYATAGKADGALLTPELTPLPDGQPNGFVRLLGDKRFYYWSGKVGGPFTLNTVGWGSGKVEFAPPLPFARVANSYPKRNAIMLTEKTEIGYRMRCAAPVGGAWRQSTYTGTTPTLEPADVFGWTSKGAKFDIIGLLEGARNYQTHFKPAAAIQVITCEAGEMHPIGVLHLSDVLAPGESQAQFRINGNVIYAITDSTVTAFEVRQGDSPSLIVLGRAAIPQGD